MSTEIQPPTTKPDKTSNRQRGISNGRMKPVTQYNISNGLETTTVTDKPSRLDSDLATTKPVTDKVSLVTSVVKNHY